MHRFSTPVFVLCVALAAGCGDSQKPDSKAGGGKKEWLTEENFRKLQPKVMDKATVNAILGGTGKPTNVEKPGLFGEVLVWEEGNKKVYVSFDRVTGQMTGAIKEGF